MYRKLHQNRYLYYTIAISLLSYFLTNYYSKFFYDGHHHGLVFDSALDLIKGKDPYRDVFLLYGLATTTVHIVSIKLFGAKILSLIKLTAVMYSLTFLIIFSLFKKYLSHQHSFFSILIIFLIHPVVILPWSNYYFFFFISIFLILFLSKSKFNFYLSFFFFGISSLIREGGILYFIIFILYIFFLKIFLKNKNFNSKYNYLNIFICTITFFIPILIFFIFILYNNLFKDFLLHAKLPELYLEFLNKNFIELFIDLIKYLFIDSFRFFFNKPYLIIFSISVIMNMFFFFNIIYKVISKKKINNIELNISFISLISIMLHSQSLHLQDVFRLICGSSVGFLILFYLINKFKEKFFMNFIFIIIFFLSFITFSLFERNDSSKIFKYDYEIRNNINSKLKYFEGNKFPKETFLNLEMADLVFSDVKTNCQIDFFFSSQLDIYYNILAKLYFNSIQKIPFYGKDIAFAEILNIYFDPDIVSRLEKKIREENILIILDFNDIFINSAQQYYSFVNNKEINYENFIIYKVIHYNKHQNGYYKKSKAILVPRKCVN